MAIKRLHYFDHQFLVEADFTDEQSYHLDMRRRLNQALHTFGIAQGLEVMKKTNKIVTVKPGIAIDNLGREMVLEAAQDIDMSGISAPAPQIFITIAYTEQQTDPSTATGASGNTRFTEQPAIQTVVTSTVSETPPPTDGSVVLLATFPLLGGNVPGNPNDALDGGVRKPAAPRAGLTSIAGVSNPGGNVDLVPAPGQAIVVTPNTALNQIAIGENHSTKTGNAHGLSAPDLQTIGALLASQYDLGKRAQATLTLAQALGGPALAAGPRPVNVPFQPKFVLAFGGINVVLSGKTYGGVTVGYFDATTGIQHSLGVGVTLNTISGAITDWIMRGLDSSSLPSDGICFGAFFDVPVVAPNLRTAETLSLRISATSPTGLTLQFDRTIPSGATALTNAINITLSMLCMG